MSHDNPEVSELLDLIPLLRSAEIRLIMCQTQNMALNQRLSNVCQLLHGIAYVVEERLKVLGHVKAKDPDAEIEEINPVA
jgi:hypothetical protein